MRFVTRKQHQTNEFRFFLNELPVKNVGDVLIVHSACHPTTFTDSLGKIFRNRFSNISSPSAVNVYRTVMLYFTGPVATFYNILVFVWTQDFSDLGQIRMPVLSRLIIRLPSFKISRAFCLANMPTCRRIKPLQLLR